MGKQVTNRIGYGTSTALFNIGNSLNLSTILKPNKRVIGKRVVGDKSALGKDWRDVGREVEIAIGRFEREQGLK